jgi:hypothetical protein
LVRKTKRTYWQDFQVALESFNFYPETEVQLSLLNMGINNLVAGPGIEPIPKVPRLGIEPRLKDPESLVLPLDDLGTVGTGSFVIPLDDPAAIQAQLY